MMPAGAGSGEGRCSEAAAGCCRCCRCRCCCCRRCCCWLLPLLPGGQTAAWQLPSQGAGRLHGGGRPPTCAPSAGT
jgi:hypothetical protein